MNREISAEQELSASIIMNLAVMIKTTKEMLKKITEHLKELISETAQKLSTFKGVDKALEAILLGETLDPSRFKNRDAFAKYNGTAPCKDSSGKRTKWVTNKRCNRRLKRALHLIAVTASRCDTISRNYYLDAISRGLSKREALKRLARRISDILFRMMRDKIAYDAKIFFADMARKEERWSKVTTSSRRNLLEISEGRYKPSLTPVVKKYKHLKEESQ